MKSVVKENQAIHYISDATIIKFITENSSMEWNECCNYVRKKNIVGSEEGCAYWEPISSKEEKNYNQDQVKWINSFFEAHPFIKKMMVVFDD